MKTEDYFNVKHQSEGIEGAGDSVNTNPNNMDDMLGSASDYILIAMIVAMMVCYCTVLYVHVVLNSCLSEKLTFGKCFLHNSVLLHLGKILFCMEIMAPHLRRNNFFAKIHVYKDSIIFIPHLREKSFFFVLNLTTEPP